MPDSADAPFSPGQPEYFYFNALRTMGHDVQAHRFSDRTRYSSPAELTDRLSKYMRYPWRRIRTALSRRDIMLRNQLMEEHAFRVKPDLIVIWGGSDVVLPETVARLKARTGAVLIGMCGYSPVALGAPQERAAAHNYDLILTNDHYHTYQWRELGVRESVALPLAGFDPEFHLPVSMSGDERQRFASRICFVGRLLPLSVYGDRLEMLNALADLDVGIWTEDREFVLAQPKLRALYRGIAFGREMVKVLSASDICINSVGCTMQRGGNMRTFEAAGIGAFQIIDRYDPRWFAEGAEIVSYIRLPGSPLKGSILPRACRPAG